MSKDKKPPEPENLPPNVGQPETVDTPSFLRKHASETKAKRPEIETRSAMSKGEKIPLPPLITHKDLAELWDVVIRAHYLAHELGNPCARSGLAAARMALALSEVLSSWATIFGEELEDLEKRSENEGGA